MILNVILLLIFEKTFTFLINISHHIKIVVNDKCNTTQLTVQCHDLQSRFINPELAELNDKIHLYPGWEVVKFTFIWFSQILLDRI